MTLSQESRGTYAQIAEAFGRAAEQYDALYQTNPVMAWMRSQNLALLKSTFAPNSQLLEIGCGTGDEALALSAAGYRVMATDISPAMVQRAQAKAEARGDETVEWRVLPAGGLRDLAAEFGQSSFAGAYASFGALNCEPNLSAVADALAALLHRGGALVCSVMNRFCAWELIWGLAHLRPRWTFRRLAWGWSQAGLASPEGRLTVPTRYYTPRGFARHFASHFQVQCIRGLPVFLPPPYLDEFWAQRPRLTSRLGVLERRLAHRFPFRALGDHTVLILKRRDEP